MIENYWCRTRDWERFNLVSASSLTGGAGRAREVHFYPKYIAMPVDYFIIADTKFAKMRYTGHHPLRNVPYHSELTQSNRNFCRCGRKCATHPPLRGSTRIKSCSYDSFAFSNWISGNFIGNMSNVHISKPTRWRQRKDCKHK